MVGRSAHAPDMKDMQLMSSKFNEKGSIHLMLSGVRSGGGHSHLCITMVCEGLIFPAVYGEPELCHFDAGQSVIAYLGDHKEQGPVGI